MASRNRSGRRVKPAGGPELLWWYFMRISGLALVLLALGHLFITHILNNVEVINYAFVADRWANPRTGVLWRLWDLTMINLAVLHGGNGLREILDEYINRPGRRVVAHTLIWTAATALIVVGSYAILQFQADTAYIRRFNEANPRLNPPFSEAGAAPLAPEHAPEVARVAARPRRANQP